MTSLNFLRFLEDELETPYVVSCFFNRLQNMEFFNGALIRLHQRQQHRKLFCRLHGVRQVGRHEKQVTGFQVAQPAAQEKLTLARQNLDQRLLGGGVLGQFLPFGKTEQHDAAIGRAHQSSADNAVGRKLRFPGQRNDFLPIIYTKEHIIDGDGTDALTTHPPTLEDFPYKSVRWHKKQLADMRRACF